MNEKLNGGDSFPNFPLKLVDGSELTLPGQPTANYVIVLFYRGAF
ncbi:MAG: peroxiredoxin [Gammaproteobacteria bacterium]|jgi:peroxiredoxin